MLVEISFYSLTSTFRQVMLSVWRIGEPARKHGVIDADIWHAVRTAMRQVVVDEDLTMLIGPASERSTTGDRLPRHRR